MSNETNTTSSEHLWKRLLSYAYWNGIDEPELLKKMDSVTIYGNIHQALDHLSLPQWKELATTIFGEMSDMDFSRFMEMITLPEGVGDEPEITEADRQRAQDARDEREAQRAMKLLSSFIPAIDEYTRNIQIYKGAVAIYTSQPDDNKDVKDAVEVARDIYDEVAFQEHTNNANKEQ